MSEKQSRKTNDKSEEVREIRAIELAELARWKRKELKKPEHNAAEIERLERRVIEFTEQKRRAIALKEQARKATEKEREKEYFAFLSDSINKHLDTLLRKKSVLIREGDYGEILFDDWVKEVDRFLSIIDPDSRWGVDRSVALRYIIETIDKEEIKAESEGTTQKLDISDLGWEEFEVYCASLLESKGWKVNRTPPSGDQGVDLVAEKNEHRIVIQCKKYNSSVGNKAVQEVYSGMSFYDANEAIVVSNSSYTKSAQELANKLNVKLLHYTEIESL